MGQNMYPCAKARVSAQRNRRFRRRDRGKWPILRARKIKTSVVRTAPFRRQRFGYVCPISYEANIYLTAAPPAAEKYRQKGFFRGKARKSGEAALLNAEFIVV